MLRFPISFVFLLFFVSYVHTQNDTTLLLKPERLTEKDILPRDFSQEPIKIISATRHEEDIHNTPFTVWVATADDIMRNGWVTLCDVLRAAPGIKVSQPGNAIEGETFLIRGLSGNQYMKILINDVPIKPSIAIGMPIGAQLPIRQAERIEVLYNPSGAMYGDDACAGVVNIILKETERPIFTQADLSFNLNYNSLDLMFGGKLGKDKNIFRYSIYGSSTVREKTDIYDNVNPFLVYRYVPLALSQSVYKDHPNFLQEGSSIPVLAPLPHESRLFGINLTWRGLHFTYHRMVRFDHSALGLNPVAVSYANPSNRISEQIQTMSLGFQRKRKRRTSTNTISAVNYIVDNTSTTTYIFDQLSSASYYLRSPQPLKYNVLIADSIQTELTSGTRYAGASALEGRFESRHDWRLGKYMGLNISYFTVLGGGTPLYTHYVEPPKISVFEVSAVNGISGVSNFYNGVIGDVGLTSQLAYHNRKLHILAGTALNISLFSPRLGVLYHIDSAWTVRGNYSKSKKLSNAHKQANGFYFNRNTRQFEGGYGFFDIFSSPETNQLLEIAVRYDHKGVSGELIGFRQKSSNMYRPGVFSSFDLFGFEEYKSYQFEKLLGTSSELWGVQCLLKSESRSILNFTTRRKKSVVSSRSEFYIQYITGTERYDDIYNSSNAILNQPRWHTQFRTFFGVTSKMEIMFASNRQTKIRLKSSTYDAFYTSSVSRPDEYPKFRTWEMNARLFLSNQFLVYVNIQNLFNREHIGLDATGTIDDLFYNVQPGRSIRLGVNYNMN